MTVTVAELIKELQELDPNLPVYVYADHGQTLIQQYHVSVWNVEELDYYAEEVYSEDDDDSEATVGIPVCVISD